MFRIGELYFCYKKSMTERSSQGNLKPYEITLSCGCLVDRKCGGVVMFRKVNNWSSRTGIESMSLGQQYPTVWARSM